MLKTQITENIEVYRKLRDYLDSIGFGYGHMENEEELEYLGEAFAPRDAEYFINVSKDFDTAKNVAEKMGVSEAEAGAQMYDMSTRGLLYREKIDGQYQYRVAPVLHGILEFRVGHLQKPEADAAVKVLLNSELLHNFYSFLPFQRSMPVRPEAVAEGELLPGDDVREVVRNARSIAVSNCVCRVLKKLEGGECKYPLETCLSLNGWADYYVENLDGRYITTEEALAILDQSDRLGLSVHMSNCKEPEVICNCCNCCCGLIAAYTAFPDADAVKLLTNYRMELDREKCVNCGICADRCPTKALTMVDGKLEFNSKMCSGCGLCVTGCPKHAPILRRKEETYSPEGTTWFDTYKDMHNVRMEKEGK